MKYCHVFENVSWPITHFSTDITQITFIWTGEVVAYLNFVVIKMRDSSPDNFQVSKPASKCISDPLCSAFT